MESTKGDRRAACPAEGEEHDRDKAPAAAMVTDPTGRRPAGEPTLCDWRQFHDRLRDAAIQSARTDNPLALLLVELRDFEERGDAFSSAAIRLFLDRVGERGSAARYGRDTLIAILPCTTLDQATLLGDSFRTAVSELGEAQAVGPIELLTVAMCGFDPDEPLGHLLKRAFDRLRAARAAPAAEAPRQAAGS